MSDTTTTSLTLKKSQRAAIDQARGDVSMAKFILRAVGVAVKAAGIDWPQDNIQAKQQNVNEEQS